MQPLDISQIISQAISFLILLWVLRRFAWRPLLGMLDQRQKRIEQGLKDVELARRKAERVEQEYTQRLSQIEEESRAKLQEAIREGKRIAMEIQTEARAQSQDILAKAKETLDLEVAKARVRLRDQVTEMTMEILERVLHQKLDAETDARLVEAALDELER